MAETLTLAHDNLRCGVPYLRERRLISIRTPAYLIVFDTERVSPLYTMIEIWPGDEPAVERKDRFSSGDPSLPDELNTTEKHYANWNRANPDFLIDKGHSMGSQYRRGGHVEQSDIDTLAGVTPTASKTNRHIKGPLESAILVQARKNTHTFLVQGPVWYGREPSKGILESGQWIPDALFISTLFLRRRTVRSWTWLMENSTTIRGANLHEITLDELERLTDLYLWSHVRSNKFDEGRSKLNSGRKWWLAGQPESR